MGTWFLKVCMGEVMVKVKITEQVLLKRCDTGLRKHVAYIRYLRDSVVMTWSCVFLCISTHKHCFVRLCQENASIGHVSTNLRCTLHMTTIPIPSLHLVLDVAVWGQLGYCIHTQCIRWNGHLIQQRLDMMYTTRGERLLGTCWVGTGQLAVTWWENTLHTYTTLHRSSALVMPLEC